MASKSPPLPSPLCGEEINPCWEEWGRAGQVRQDIFANSINTN